MGILTSRQTRMMEINFFCQLIEKLIVIMQQTQDFNTINFKQIINSKSFYLLKVVDQWVYKSSNNCLADQSLPVKVKVNIEFDCSEKL